MPWRAALRISRQGRDVAFIAAILACLAVPALAGEMAQPDPTLTPGAVRTTSAAKACLRPLPPRPSEREWLALKWGRMTAYGIPWSRRGDYELDHLIPRCAGGADTIDDLWPQPWPEARIKDRDEAKLCRRLCAAPSDERLRAVQDYFQRGEWAR